LPASVQTFALHRNPCFGFVQRNASTSNFFTGWSNKQNAERVTVCFFMKNNSCMELASFSAKGKPTSWKMWWGTTEAVHVNTDDLSADIPREPPIS
jgi:hypothetical protein